MTAVAPVVREYLAKFRITVDQLEDLDPTTILAVSVKADYESNYGEEPGWDDVAYDANELVPEYLTAMTQAYVAHHRMSTSELLDEAEKWLAHRSPARRAAAE